MKKLAIITPNEKRFLQDAGDRMPLGALHVATSAERAGHDVRVYDMNHTTREQLFNAIENTRPDVIGYSVISSPSYHDMRNLSYDMRRLSPNSLQVVGGYHSMARPQDFEDADYIVKGDGEETINFILSEGLTTNHPNYPFDLSSKNRVVMNDVQRTDVNKIPFVNRRLLNTDNYQMQQDGKRAATLISSRGCPFTCIFCGNYDRKVRFRNPENIRGELADLKDMGFEALYFLDDAFTAKKKHAKEVSDVVADFDMPFRVTTRADLLNEDIVSYMSNRGLEIASLGIESGNNEVLRNCNKKMTTDDNLKAVQLLHQYAVKTKGFFIFGLPGEGPKEAEQTIEFAKRLKQEGLNSADFYAMTPFPGTPISNNPEKYDGKILHENWGEYLEAGKMSVNLAWETSTLSAEQIKYFINKAKEEWNKS